MKNLSFVFVAALTLAAFGCKKKGGADCDKAIDHGMELAKADMAKHPGMDDAMLQKMKDLGVQHCKDDKWSDDALKCMVDAKAETDAQACYGKLTKDQQDKMNKAAMEMATSGAGTVAPAGSAEPTPPTTGGAMGSDTAPAAGSAAAAGSAEAGSAAAPK